MITGHAIRRYQERIENVPLPVVTGRIRRILAGHQDGPPCKIVQAADGTVMTVMCATPAQEVSAAKRGAWQIRNVTNVTPK